jgi:FkbM family methyltransferase
MITRFIYPPYVRERISWRCRKFPTPRVKQTDVPIWFGKNIKLDLHREDVAHWFMIFNGYYERRLSKFIDGFARSPGGLMVDVGANYGYYSCIWASVSNANRVLAVEASPLNIPGLTNNVEKNGLAERVEILPKAMGKQAGKMKFDTRVIEGQTGWGRLSPNGDPGTVEVEVCKLDDCIAEGERITVLKIDTEGADTWVLYGAERLLRERRIDHIFFENSTDGVQALGVGLPEATEFLTSLGYKVDRLGEREYHAFLNNTP